MLVKPSLGGGCVQVERSTLYGVYPRWLVNRVIVMIAMPILTPLRRGGGQVVGGAGDWADRWAGGRVGRRRASLGGWVLGITETPPHVIMSLIQSVRVYVKPAERGWVGGCVGRWVGGWVGQPCTNHLLRVCCVLVCCLFVSSGREAAPMPTSLIGGLVERSSAAHCAGGNSTDWLSKRAAMRLAFPSFIESPQFGIAVSPVGVYGSICSG